MYVHVRVIEKNRHVIVLLLFYTVTFSAFTCETQLMLNNYNYLQVSWY